MPEASGRVTTIHYEADGDVDAPPLVLSNSLGTTVEMWAAQVPALARHFRVIRYDQRGHGASSVPPGPYSIPDLALDVVALLDGLGIERASFCGLSLGGMAGMWLGVNAPERVDRLALCCTSAYLGPPERWLERAAIVRDEGPEALVPAMLERWLTPGFRATHPGAVAMVIALLVSIDAEGYASCCEAIADMDQRSSIAAITAPTLVVAGAADPATPPAHGAAIHEQIEGSTLVVLDNAAHLANIDQPVAFTAAVLDHLTSPVPHGRHQ